MEKNNIKCFESIYDLLSTLFDDVQCTDSCKCQGDCNCTCHKNNTEESIEQDTPLNNVSVWSFTDEDFKDEEKLNQYVDYLEDLRETFESNDNSIFSLVKAFGFDYNQIIDELIEHAESVYDKSNPSPEEDCDNNPQTYTTQSLAENYVKQVLAPTFNGLVSERTQNSLIDSYKKFADWILEHN